LGAQGQRRTQRLLDQRICAADDFEDSEGKNVLTFYQAQDAAKKLARGEDGCAATAPITVDGALKDYRRDLISRNANHPYNAERPRYGAAPGARTVCRPAYWRHQSDPCPALTL
jgi:hypothetical protein